MRRKRQQTHAKAKNVPHTIRLAVLCFLVLTILALITWRAFDLTVLDRQFLQHQGNARSIRTLSIPAYRGMIVDRHGSPLAVSTPVQSAWINPKVFSAIPEQLRELSQILGIPAAKVNKLVASSQGKEFIYLKRHLPPSKVKRMKALGITGLSFREEFKRFYPEGENVATLLGFTDVDDHGIEGLELAYQDWLMGVPGKRRVLKDRVGRIIDVLDLIQTPHPGHTLELSIDKRIQYFAHQALKDTVTRYKAKAGSIVVLDAKTGEVLAITNVPSFNPNARQKYTRDHYRNRAITDLFEPGSVLKPLSVASALNTGKFNAHTMIDTSPSWMVVDGHTIQDMHDYGLIDVSGVLQRSSNVGVSKMVLSSPANVLINDLRNCGFGLRTSSGFPGENGGTITSTADSNRFVLATLSFGYGISMTALQLARSYLVFANEGQVLPISLLHKTKPGSPSEVFKPKVASEMLTMLDSVVNSKQGTGKRARIQGYRVAGKTGTARIAGPDGYEPNKHIASFVGIAPVSSPKIIVAVVIHEPREGGYYGGVVAAPLCGKVIETALRMLNVPPDDGVS